MAPTQDEVKLASAIWHLAEFIESGEQVDLESARAILREPRLCRRLLDMKKKALLPVPRRRVEIIDRLFDFYV